MAAMIDPHLNVFRATRLGDVEYFCDEELAEQLEPGKWNRATLGDHARHAAAARRAPRPKSTTWPTIVVDNFAQFKQCYGLEDDPMLVEPGWADFLIEALASPGVAVLLLMIGGVGALLRIARAGHRHRRLRGRWSASCLFFWSRYLGGTAGWLEVLLFVAGVTCLLLEIFVIPGFGIFGLGGGGWCWPR